MAKKILVVDDERHIVRLVQVNLERAGYEVVVAFDGKDALVKVELEKPDLVTLDVMMPYMDGFEVLQNIRKNPATRDLPVIMLTNKTTEADVFRGWQSGVDCYLTKPFNPMELISFVKRELSKLEGGESKPPNPFANYRKAESIMVEGVRSNLGQSRSHTTRPGSRLILTPGFGS